jgi:hypothetical protein
MEVRVCTVCKAQNPVDYSFCINCGNSLPPAVPASVPRQSPQSVPGYYPPAPGVGPKPGPMGPAGISLANIWGPFAGYGTRGRHVSWLLDNLGDRAEALRDAVASRFAERQIPSAAVEPRMLTDKGVVVEQRLYHLIRRGVATAGLYIARFGEDLYISQVTYAKGAISWLRALVLGLMLLFELYFLISSTITLSGTYGGLGGMFGGYGSGSSAGLAAMVCCTGPLGLLNTLALQLAGLHMVYKFITEKDPWMLLRAPLNEFHHDDIMALEKAVEETVRQSMDAVGIDKGLLPPAEEYGVRRRLI